MLGTIEYLQLNITGGAIRTAAFEGQGLQGGLVVFNRRRTTQCYLQLTVVVGTVKGNTAGKRSSRYSILRLSIGNCQRCRLEVRIINIVQINAGEDMIAFIQGLTG